MLPIGTKTPCNPVGPVVPAELVAPSVVSPPPVPPVGPVLTRVASVVPPDGLTLAPVPPGVTRETLPPEPFPNWSRVRPHPAVPAMTRKTDSTTDFVCMRWWRSSTTSDLLQVAYVAFDVGDLRLDQTFSAGVG